MCGIIGYSGPRVASEVILDALKKLDLPAGVYVEIK